MRQVFVNMRAPVHVIFGQGGFIQKANPTTDERG